MQCLVQRRLRSLGVSASVPMYGPRQLPQVLPQRDRTGNCSGWQDAPIGGIRLAQWLHYSPLFFERVVYMKQKNLNMCKECNYIHVTVFTLPIWVFNVGKPLLANSACFPIRWKDPCQGKPTSVEVLANRKSYSCN